MRKSALHPRSRNTPRGGRIIAILAIVALGSHSQREDQAENKTARNSHDLADIRGGERHDDRFLCKNVTLT